MTNVNASVYELNKGEDSTISFTPDKLKSLKSSYNTALKNGKDKFVFEGKELLVSYAKYLIEYLDIKFKAK